MNFRVLQPRTGRTVSRRRDVLLQPALASRLHSVSFQAFVKSRPRPPSMKLSFLELLLSRTVPSGATSTLCLQRAADFVAIAAPDRLALVRSRDAASCAVNHGHKARVFTWELGVPLTAAIVWCARL